MPDPGEVRRIDATGRGITPGIVDVHTHYGTYLLPQTEAANRESDVKGHGKGW